MSACRTKLLVKYANDSSSFLADGLDVWGPTKMLRKSYTQVLDLVNYFKRVVFSIYNNLNAVVKSGSSYILLPFPDLMGSAARFRPLSNFLSGRHG